MEDGVTKDIMYPEPEDDFSNEGLYEKLMNQKLMIEKKLRELFPNRDKTRDPFQDKKKATQAEQLYYLQHEKDLIDKSDWEQ